MQDTFLSYRSFRWLWIACGLVLVASIIYWLDTPLQPKSGSTLYGYTVGILCGVFMSYLMWYGGRKRSYHAQHTTLRGVLSAHVWLGIAMLFLVPLHSAFIFHWNVHTLAYLVMVLTVLSGIWGAYFYRSLPKMIHSNRGGGSIENLLQQLDTINREIATLERSRSDSLTSFVTKLDIYKVPTLSKILLGNRTAPVKKDTASSLLQNLPEEEREIGISIISLIQKKFEFISSIERETKTQWYLKLWLFFHLPLSVCAMLLLIFHIISVLFYR